MGARERGRASLAVSSLANLPRQARRGIVAALLVTTATLSVGYAGRESGGVVTKQLDISGFDRIAVPGSWDVEVTRGPFSVTVTVDDHLEDDLRVERRGNELAFRLRAGLRLRGVRTLRAAVAMPELSGAVVSGSGSGSIRFGGFRDTGDRPLDLVVSGSGSIGGDGCQTRQLQARISG